MAVETPAGAASRELHKGVVLRLGIAGALIIALVFAWQGLDRTQPDTATQSPSSDPPAPAQPVVDSAKPASNSEPAPSEAQPIDAQQGMAVATEAPVTEQAKADSHEKAPVDSAAKIDKVAAVATQALTQENEAGVVVAPVLAPDAIVRPKLPDGPYLQVGVFTHPANAEELRAKLEAQGIPVHIASRVQVGPFKDKKEAESMREKLAAMGMASVLVRQ